MNMIPDVVQHLSDLIFATTQVHPLIGNLLKRPESNHSLAYESAELKIIRVLWVQETHPLLSKPLKYIRKIADRKVSGQRERGEGPKNQNLQDLVGRAQDVAGDPPQSLLEIKA